MCPQRIAILTWCRGLCVPMILEAVLSETKTPCGANWSQGRGQTKSDSMPKFEHLAKKKENLDPLLESDLGVELAGKCLVTGPCPMGPGWIQFEELQGAAVIWARCFAS